MRDRGACFAARGFGKARPSPSGKRKRSPDKKAPPEDLSAIRILASSKEKFARRVAGVSGEIARALACDEVAVIDGVLGLADCEALRCEAERVHASFVAEHASLDFDQPGIDRTNAELLSPEDLRRAPRTVAMMLALTGLSPRLAAERGARLSSDASANMLSCYLRGGAFPVHLDNHGGDDRRLIGLIYYMNPGYVVESGGRFVPWNGDEPSPGIEPRGDRLIAFYCDRQDHSVEEFTPFGDYYRYALTVWLMDDATEALRPDRRTRSPTDAHRRLRDSLATTP
ncbi:hypothetical protein CTAYLR_005592 [Chrysophaeum taylorii]|uniref:Fe2OG dioxygenase domain-containing protein n=1 Tax=Chrysophaeum taylorii TaxID=2483200 RepID=A0AAD7U541_9STRA|nr:hypothetical protein CTAYLR_005592 [Chrysophaeum taylorii]